MSKPANSLQKASLMPKPSFPSKQWGQTEHDSNPLFPKLQVILVLWNKALKPWPVEAKRHWRCTLVKQRHHPNFFFSLREAKGHEMRDATTKTVNCWEKQVHGDNILSEIKQDSKHRGVCLMQHIFWRHDGFPIACFKKKVQLLLLLQLFW